MPSTYAHRRFGRDVEGVLPQPLKELVDENYDCYALGLHGPDLLFYYKPLQTNAVNAKGYAMHEQFVSKFYKRAAEIYRERGCKDFDRAYLFGFMCHFSLDSQAHPIVSAQMKKKGLCHTEIESAFDRHLLLKDGIVPLKYDMTGHIINDEKTRQAAQAYFEITPEQAQKAIKSIKFYSGLLNSGCPAVRAFVCAVLSRPSLKETRGMVMPKKIDERCEEAIGELEKAYAAAVIKATGLIKNLDAYLAGEAELSPLLDRDFE